MPAGGGRAPGGPSPRGSVAGEGGRFRGDFHHGASIKRHTCRCHRLQVRRLNRTERFSPGVLLDEPGRKADGRFSLPSVRARYWWFRPQTRSRPSPASPSPPFSTQSYCRRFFSSLTPTELPFVTKVWVRGQGLLTPGCAASSADPTTSPVGEDGPSEEVAWSRVRRPLGW